MKLPLQRSTQRLAAGPTGLAAWHVSTLLACTAGTGENAANTHLPAAPAIFGWSSVRDVGFFLIH